MDFDFQPTLAGPSLVVRPVRAEDREALGEAASDPLIWAGHPVKDRHLPEVFDPYFDFLLASASAVVIAEAGGRVIGCSRFYVAADEPEAVSIGFTFLTRDHWGGATNRDVKRLMLDHIFAQGREAWFHIAPSNLRSQKATAKLGARYVRDARLDLGTGPAEWKCYRLTQGDWAAAAGDAPQ